MQLPWVMRKALRLVSELQARARVRFALRVCPSVAVVTRPACTRRLRPQIRHDDAEFATCMSAGIINIAENYAFTGAQRRSRGRTHGGPRDGPAATGV